MSFEQQEFTREQEKKQKKKKEDFEREKFFEEKKAALESERLLNKLALELSEKFGISISEAKNIIGSESSEKLGKLKIELHEKNKDFQDEQLDSAIINARKQIEFRSSAERKNLLQTLREKVFSPEKDEYFVSRSMFSPDIIERAIHPRTLGDQLLGAGIGTIDSLEAIILFLWGLAKGILLTPYHIYLKITQK